MATCLAGILGLALLQPQAASAGTLTLTNSTSTTYASSGFVFALNPSYPSLGSSFTWGSSFYTGSSGGSTGSLGNVSLPNVNDPPSPALRYYFPDSAVVTMSMPTLADPALGVLTIDVLQNTVPEVRAATGTAGTDLRAYSTATGYSFTGSAVGLNQGVVVRWFWNDRELPSISQWLANGSDGKWGAYRVEIWDTARDWYKKATSSQAARYVGYGTAMEAPDYTQMTLVSNGWYRHDKKRLAGSVAFQAAVRDKMPLATPGVPVFELEPVTEIVRAPATTGEVTLSVRANAAAPFEYRWFKEGAGVTGRQAVAGAAGMTLAVPLSSLTESGHTYTCEAWNADGTAVSAPALVRLPRRPRVGTRFIPGLFQTGREAVLGPRIESVLPCEITWTGPALADGSGRATVDGRGILRIAQARLSDGGQYRLTVTNAEGTSVRDVLIAMVEFPETVMPLRTGTTLKIGYAGLPGRANTNAQLLRTQSFSGNKKSFDVADVFRRTYPEWEWTFKKPTADVAGEYLCSVDCSTSRQEERLDNSGRYMLASVFDHSRLEQAVAVIVPDAKAELPDFTLPQGRVRVPYDFEPPLPDTIAAAGTRFTMSGLPRGLKVNAATGRITGVPEQGGDFRVKITVANAAGIGATRIVPLRIDPLDGAVGAFVLFWMDPYGTATRCDLTVTGSGAYTLKGLAKPVKGLLSVTAAGQVTLVNAGMQLDFDRAADRVSGTSGSDSISGWRQTWSAKRPASSYAGRYHFDVALSAPPPGLTYSAAGVQHGACVVSATGGTLVTYHQDTNVPAVTGAFLGPEGEVLMLPRQPYGYGAAVLTITADRIAGSAAPVWAWAHGPRDTVNGLMASYRYVRGAWTQNQTGEPVAAGGAGPVTHTFAGHRYVPEARGMLLAGLDPLSPRLTFAMGTADCAGLKDVRGTLDAKDTLKLPAPSPDTWHLTARLNRATGELTGTVRLLVPTGSRPDGSVIWNLRPHPYHACLVTIPGHRSGSVIGYRIAGFARTPLFTSVTSRDFLWPLTSVPVELAPVIDMAPPPPDPPPGGLPSGGGWGGIGGGGIGSPAWPGSPGP